MDLACTTYRDVHFGIGVSAFAIAATPMSIKHNQKLSTPYELITKGTILHKHIEDDGEPLY